MPVNAFSHQGAAAKPRISVVCVDFNGTEFTEKLCASLAKQEGLGAEFDLSCLVVDNSDDARASESLRALVERYSWTKYLRAGRNLGYFGGLNLGLSHLDLRSWDYVVICNNDLEFAEDFCSRLARAVYVPEAMAICPAVVTADGIHQNPHLPTRMAWLRKARLDLYFSSYYFARMLVAARNFLVRPTLPDSQLLVAREIHMGIGACYALTRAFCLRFESLHFPHFLYGEEAYLSDQIHGAGGVLWYDPGLHVRHAESAATKKLPKRASYEFARAGYRSYRRML